MNINITSLIIRRAAIPLFVCFILVLSSCGKKRSIHIRAVNAATGEVYGGLEYIILSSRTTANGEKFRTEASGLLSATGEAIEEVKVKGNRTYKVRVTAPPNNCYNKEVEQYFESKYDQNGKFTFEFAPCAYLMRNITNVNCQGANDYMILYSSNQINSLGATGWEFFGCNGYIGDHYSAVPEGKYYYRWDVTKNSVTQTFYDTITLLPGEYRIYNIDY